MAWCKALCGPLLFFSLLTSVSWAQSSAPTECEAHFQNPESALIRLNELAGAREMAEGPAAFYKVVNQMSALAEGAIRFQRNDVLKALLNSSVRFPLNEYVDSSNVEIYRFGRNLFEVAIEVSNLEAMKLLLATKGKEKIGLGRNPSPALLQVIDKSPEIQAVLSEAGRLPDLKRARHFLLTEELEEDLRDFVQDHSNDELLRKILRQLLPTGWLHIPIGKEQSPRDFIGVADHGKFGGDEWSFRIDFNDHEEFHDGWINKYYKVETKFSLVKGPHSRTIRASFVGGVFRVTLERDEMGRNDGRTASDLTERFQELKLVFHEGRLTHITLSNWNTVFWVTTQTATIPATVVQQDTAYMDGYEHEARRSYSTRATEVFKWKGPKN